MTRFADIRKWAHDRNLIEGSTPEKQFVKLMEEVGELAADLARGRSIEDDIGDIIVVLTIIAEQKRINIEGCIELAWDEIKDRKGKMVAGIFIKEVV